MKRSENPNTKMVRVGAKQYRKLKAMADASGISMAQLMSVLVDNARILGVTATRQISYELLIEQEQQRRIDAYPTLAEVEEKENSDG